MLKNKKIAVLCHTHTTGQGQELEKYILEKQIDLFAFIGHPMPISKTEKGSFCNLYKNGKLIQARSARHTHLPFFMQCLRDFFYSLKYFLSIKEKFDLCYAANSFNAITAIILKKMGKINFVIFNTVDYIPVRYGNKLLNKIYHLMDKIACYHSDCVWNLSSVMEEERYLSGKIKKEKSSPQLVVPMGNNFHGIKRLAPADIERYTIGFLGVLGKAAGLQLVIEALPEIKKQIPEIKLLVLGAGPYRTKLEKLAAKLAVENNIEFAGFIPDHAQVEARLASCAVAVAPYEPESNNYTKYTDPGKPKVYLGCGLPVIITKLPQIAFIIDKRQAGCAIDYDAGELACAVVKLLKDDSIYAKYRENAIQLASEFEWHNVFDRAFKETLNIMQGS